MNKCVNSNGCKFGCNKKQNEKIILHRDYNTPVIREEGNNKLLNYIIFPIIAAVAALIIIFCVL